MSCGRIRINASTQAPHCLLYYATHVAPHAGHFAGYDAIGLHPAASTEAMTVAAGELRRLLRLRNQMFR